MLLKTRKNEDVVIVDIVKDITHERAAEFESEMNPLFEDTGITKVILNFQGVEYLCSPGFGMVAQLAKVILERSGEIRLLNLNQNLRKLFEISRLTKIIDVYDDESEAIKSFRST
ncbi:MAG: STAS domain-containing protein [Planctomycetes bacterium]|nr:STAS domain-containing protein [Planctomycetota bacterium]